MPLDRWPNPMAAWCCMGFTCLQLDSAIARCTYPKDKSMSLSSLETTVAQRTTIAKILGSATAVPEYSIAQSDAAMVAQQLHVSQRWHNALPALYRKSGVKRRGSVLLGSAESSPLERQTFYQPACQSHPYGPTTAERMKVFSEHAGPMLQKACAAAIENSGHATRNITHLVTVSCTGFFAPGVDIALIESLGLDSHVQRTHVGFMGCHGALNGIRVSKSIVDADPAAVVLLGAVELCSLHQQYTDDAQQLVANSLFADGAAGLVIGANDPLHSLDGSGVENHASRQIQWSVVSTLSKWIPQTTALMSWTIGDHGFRMTLDPQVPSVIEANLENELKTWLDEQSLCISDIEAWAIHPGGPRIIQASGKALGLPPQALEGSQSILAEHGNMSSPTVLFILERISQQQPDANYCILLAFGPGLCIEAVLLKSTSL
jgi:predicted naringenin-chalcone synthase